MASDYRPPIFGLEGRWYTDLCVAIGEAAAYRVYASVDADPPSPEAVEAFMEEHAPEAEAEPAAEPEHEEQADPDDEYKFWRDANDIFDPTNDRYFHNHAKGDIA